MNFCVPGVRSHEAPDRASLVPWSDEDLQSSLLVDIHSSKPAVTMATCDIQAIRTAQSSGVTQNLLLTVLVLTLFVVTKSYYNHMRRQMARCTVFVIGESLMSLTGVPSSL